MMATMIRDYDIRQVNVDQELECKAHLTMDANLPPVYITKRSTII